MKVASSRAVKKKNKQHKKQNGCVTRIVRQGEYRANLLTVQSIKDFSKRKPKHCFQAKIIL